MPLSYQYTLEFPQQIIHRLVQQAYWATKAGRISNMQDTACFTTHDTLQYCCIYVRNLNKSDLLWRPWMTPCIPPLPLLEPKRPLTDGLTPRVESGVAIPSLPRVKLLVMDAGELEDPRRSISDQLATKTAVNTKLAWQSWSCTMFSVVSQLQGHIFIVPHLHDWNTCLAALHPYVVAMVTCCWTQLPETSAKWKKKSINSKGNSVLIKLTASIILSCVWR